MQFLFPAPGHAPQRGLRLDKRITPGRAALAAVAAVSLAALGSLFPSKADAGVQRIELKRVADQRVAERSASFLSERQAFLDRASSMGFAHPELEALAAPASAHPIAHAAELALALGAVNPTQIAARQVALAEQFASEAEARADEAETAIRRVGLNPRLIVAKTRHEAEGGPLQGTAAGLGAPFTRLANGLARMEALESGLATIPHNTPANLPFVSSSFGYRADPFTGESAFHAGLDFPGPLGAPIFAAADGRVTFAGVKNGYGNCLEITHGNGMMTRYGHMSAFKAHVGELVKAGEAIGAIGNSGRSTGPHLHFEVRINDQAVNPRPFLMVRSSHP